MAQDSNRDALSHPESLVEDIKDTRADLTSKIEQLVETAKSTVTDTVDEVKDKVHETVQTVKNIFSLSYQMDRRPWLLVGLATGVGFMLGRRFPIHRPHFDIDFDVSDWVPWGGHDYRSSNAPGHVGPMAYTSGPGTVHPAGVPSLSGFAAPSHQAMPEREPGRSEEPPREESQGPGLFERIYDTVSSSPVVEKIKDEAGKELTALKDEGIKMAEQVVKGLVVQALPTFVTQLLGMFRPDLFGGQPHKGQGHQPSGFGTPRPQGQGEPVHGATASSTTCDRPTNRPAPPKGGNGVS